MLFVLLSSGCSSQNIFYSSNTSSSVGVEKEKFDIMSQSFSLVDYDPEKAFNIETLDKNIHKNALMLFENPLDVASYVMSFKKPSEKILDLKTVVDFYRFSLAENSNVFDIYGYKTYNDINDSLTELFRLFGTTDGLDEAKNAFKSVEPRIQKAISVYLSSAMEAYKIISEQTKGISQYDFYKCQQFLYCPPQNEGERKKAFDEVKEICENVDTEQMLKAFNIMFNATDELRQGIRYNNNLTQSGEELTVETPLGAICFGTNGDDVYRSPCALLIIDLNGDDEYYGKIAASSSLTQPISVVIDLGGNDTYDNNGYTAVQGSGILGVGILFDNSGDDTYSARSFSQGACLFGGGALIDLMGNDSYESAVTSQSAGYFGSALLVDLNGNDKYNAHGYSQAFAGNSAVCMLVDRNGNDKYRTTPSVAVGYEDMRLEQLDAAANFSQGCAVEDALAGLIELNGNDEYIGGAYAQGVGYNGGIGMLSDYQGNDKYLANSNSQAVAENYSVGALFDMAGDDSHALSTLDVSAVQGNGLGYVKNGGVAVLVNDLGNDFYYTHTTSFGTIFDTENENKKPACAIFVDTQGDDVYHALSADKAFGYGFGSLFVDGQGIDEYKKLDLKDADKLFGSEKNNGVFWDIEPPEREEPTDSEKEENKEDTDDTPEYEFTFLVKAIEEHLTK